MQNITIDITKRGVAPLVNVTDYDAMSRFFALTILDGGAPYTPPDGATYSVWYKNNESHGWYDTITEPDDGTHPAVTADGNVLTVEIAAAATTSCGELAVMITGADGYQLTVTGIMTRSSDIPGYDGAEVENYYNVFITRMQENAARAENAADIAVAYGATVEVDEEAQQLNITHHSDTEGGVGWLFGSAVTSSAEGSVAAFADGANDVAVKSLVAEITPVQSGSGDPSPTNVRAISGRTGLTVTVQSGETENEYPVTWQTQAGAIYGGTLNVTTGVLTVEYGKYTIPSDIAVTDRITSQNRVYWNFTDMANGVYLTDARTVCNRLPKSAPSQSAAIPCICIGATAGGSYVYLQGVTNIDGVTDLATLRTWLANNPVEFTYKLATPLDPIQLSPTEVKTLLGGNSIYTDAGAVSVEYVADTKLYIDNKVAELQALILEN